MESSGFVDSHFYNEKARIVYKKALKFGAGKENQTSISIQIQWDAIIMIADHYLSQAIDNTQELLKCFELRIVPETDTFCCGN